jgi:hypothetical protein
MKTQQQWRSCGVVQDEREKNRTLKIAGHGTRDNAEARRVQRREKVHHRGSRGEQRERGKRLA